MTRPRRYILIVVLLGVVGALCIPAFVLIARARIETRVRTALASVAERQGAALRNVFVRVLRQEEERNGQRLDPASIATWRRLAPELEELLLDLPELVGVEVTAGAEKLRIADPLPIPNTVMFEIRGGIAHADLGNDVLGLAFWCPPEAPPEGRARVFASMRSFTLAERAQLEDFVTFGAAGLGVAFYLLAAVILLVDRAQSRLASQEREKAVRLRAMGEVAGGIAHEVRNPLNTISLSLQYMERLQARGDRQPAPTDFARVHVELGKIRKVVDNFVKFARIRDLVVGHFDLGEVVDDVLTRLAPAIDPKRITVEVGRDPDLRLEGDREKLAEVVETVVQNALDAMKDHPAGSLRIRAQATRRRLRLVIRDSGEVSDPDALRNVFVPYYTTRENALGLGMTIARTLVESHGGTIEAAPAHGGGCAVTIELPRRLT